MALRLEYRAVAPRAITALAGLNTYSDSCSVAPAFRRLLEVLVSRINNCSYCQQIHERQYLDLGERVSRLDALDNWRESKDLSDAEKAAFAWAESITRISTDGAPDTLCQALLTYASFLMRYTEHRHVIRRVQFVAKNPYAEIYDNTISAKMLSLDLLRCKLSFFGSIKLDPKSDRWLRITMFQGAPFPDELANFDPDDLIFANGELS